MHILAKLVSLPFLAIWFLSGWRPEGTLPKLDKMVIIGVPHTTNWDYWHVLMLAVYFGRKPFTTFKAEWLKRPIIGTLIRWAGGIGIDRSKSHNVVQQLGEELTKAKRMILVFTPEGTRSKRDHWKTGFYYTALQAKVPIILAYVDYQRKRGGIGPTLSPSGDIEADMEIIREFYSTHGHGKYPEQANDIRVLPHNHL